MQGSQGLLETDTSLTKLTATERWIISVLLALRTLGAERAEAELSCVGG